jgi:death-on-curing protein
MKYGCVLDHSAGGSNMKITRMIAGGGLLKKPKVLTSNISYGGEGRDVLVSTLNKIRADLQLDEEHGIDSAAFYANLPFATDEFIVKYRKILHRLAKF